MNKTVTINLNGILFNINEEAYEKLKQYLASIKQRFIDEKGGDEILTDIESRIAEMLYEKINNHKQVITENDINEVIAIMGQPEDFVDEKNKHDTDQFESNAQNEPREKGPKRFFRDSENKIIGGVCSGIGYYFGVDPVIIRLLFGGIVFFGGSGVIMYLILLIISPKAITTSEKLQMKGEKIDIDSIHKSVNKEAEHLKRKFNDLGNNADEFSQKIKESKVSELVINVGRFIYSIIKLLFVFIGKFIGVLFLIFGVLFLISLIFSIFGLSTLSGVLHINELDTFMLKDLYHLVFESNYEHYLITIGLLVTLGLPIFLILYTGLKILFNLKPLGKRLNTGITVIWLSGLVLIILSVFQISTSFSRQESHAVTFNLSPTIADTIIINTNTEHFAKNAQPFKGNNPFIILKNYDKTLFLNSVKLNIIENEQDSISIKVIQKAKGGNNKNALKRAENINYTYSINKNKITFNPYFSIKKSNLYRGQKVQIEVGIPIGKTVYLDNSSGWIIYDIKNTSNTLDRNMTGRYWKMTKKGLKCFEI